MRANDMAPDPAISVELLLRHAAGLRALARGLLHDEHAAEEVVQDSLAAALERPPGDSARVGGWLRRVARKQALKRLRGEERRRTREERASRAEALASTDEVVAQREVLRRVVDAVLGLPEPYQSVVLLRHFEDLPPREIARRRGAKVGTVNVQLQRAHAMLRGRLDADAGGERRRWAFALAAVTGGARPEGSPIGELARRAGEGVAMHGKLSIGVVGALLAGLGALRAVELRGPQTREETPQGGVTEVLLEDLGPAQGPAGQDGGDDAGGRVALGPQEPADPPSAPGAGARFSIELLVVDDDDRPRAGVAVVAAPPEHPLNVLGHTDAEGRLRRSWSAEGERYPLVLGLDARVLQGFELRAGRPLRLRLAARPRVPTLSDLPLEVGSPAAPEPGVALIWGGGVEPAGPGSFRFTWVLPGSGEGLDELVETVEDHDEVEEAVFEDLGALRALGYVGEDEPEPERTVSAGGVVLRADGTPAAGARVVARSGGELRLLRTDAEGAWSVELPAGAALELSAGGGDFGLAGARFELEAEPRAQQVRWDAVLERGTELRVALRTPEGADLRGWRAEFEADPAGEPWQDATALDGGRLAIPNLPARAGRLLVFASAGELLPRRVFEGVLPGAGERELSLDARDLATGRLSVRVTDEAGEALPEAEVTAWQLASGRGVPLAYDASAERHRSVALPLGRYRVVAGTPLRGYVELGELELAPDEERSLGGFSLPAPGTLTLSPELEARAERERLALVRQDTGSFVVLDDWRPDLPHALPAGDYALVPLTAGATPVLRARVEPGAAATLDGPR